MKYDVIRKTMPRRYVASLRKVIPSCADEGMLWNQLGQEPNCYAHMANPCYPLAVFHDEGYKKSDTDVEVQLAVQGQHENGENVVFKTVEPFEIASTIFKGRGLLPRAILLDSAP